MNTKHVILGLLIIITCLALVLTAEKYYWKYWDFEPIKVYSIKILNQDKRVEAGGFIVYEIDFDKKMDLVGTVYRQIRNSYIYSLTPVQPPLKRLGRQKIIDVIPVPRVAEYGTFYLHWTVSYPLNHEDRVINVSTVSEAFQVVPPKLAKGPKGDPGKPGVTGKTGKQGETGDKGATGEAGATGKKGGFSFGK